MQRSEAKPHVAANLTFIEARALTGPGYYAAQVFEGLAAMADAGQLPFRLHGYVQDGAGIIFPTAPMPILPVWGRCAAVPVGSRSNS
jgi:hypothetical protein